MNLAIVFLVSFLGGLGGLLLTGVIANLCVDWYSITKREGAAGYFVVFTSLGGGLAGLIVGFITALVVALNFGPSFGHELGATVCIIFPIAAVSAVICRLLAHIPPMIDGRELNLEVEFRFPAGTASPPAADGPWWMQLDPQVSSKEHRECVTDEVNTARLEDGRWILPAKVFLFTARGKRFVSLFNIGSREKDRAGFTLPIPAQPGKEFLQWSAWFPGQQPPEKMSCRFRVQFVPPPKTEADREAEEAARKEAEFVALLADAPLPEWLVYLDYPQPQTDRALQAIAKRPNLVREIEEVALGEDTRMAGLAIRCISKLPGPTDQFNAPMQRVGLDIAGRLRKFNTDPVGQNPADLTASNIGSRYSAWHTTITALREKSGGDFTPELKIILELSRVLKDNSYIQLDVCRMASYYLREWAGVEPLPTDPKPS